MKTLFKTLAYLALTGVLISSCSSDESKKSDSNSETKDAEERISLTYEKKAENVLKNTSLISMGSIMLFMNEVFNEQVGLFNEIMQEGPDNEAIDELNSHVVKAGNAMFAEADQVMMYMDKGFDAAREEDPESFQQLMDHEIMQEAIAIAEKYDLPEGFKPLTQDLSANDLHKYMVFLQVCGEYEDHPVVKTYFELLAWSTRASENPNYILIIDRLMQ